MSQHAPTPSNAPVPADKNKNADGEVLPRTIDKIDALNPDVASHSETGAKKNKAHWLGFESRRKSWRPITNNIPNALPKKTKGISDQPIGGSAAAPAFRAPEPDNAPAITTPIIIQRQIFIAL